MFDATHIDRRKGILLPAFLCSICTVNRSYASKRIRDQASSYDELRCSANIVCKHSRFPNTMTFDPYDDSPLFDDPAERLLVGLNPAQRMAVTHKDGPLLVLAGPGSGKTRVVTHRIAWLLLNGVKDSQIAALTFTNKAAEEMKTRLARLAPGNRVWIGTFHRFCAYLLRYYAQYVGLEENYAIYDVDQCKKLLESVVPKNSLPNGVDIQKIASAISWAKNALVTPDVYCGKEGSLLGRVVEDAYPAYQAALKKANAVDFDDLLLHIATLLKKNPQIRANLDYRFRYVLVDEYQDTNLVQYMIARALSVDYPNLAVTGDPDQSIYGWRGANIQNILNFEQDFEDAKVVRLEQNYRSDKSVLRVADFLIKHNVYRKDKELFTENKEGEPPRIVLCLDQQEEAETIAAEIAAEIAAGRRKAKDYAVFYRINALSRNLEYALKRYNVPFQLVRGLEFFNRKEVKDICSYLQLVYNPNDVVSFKRVVNLPARGVGNVSLARLESYAESANTTLLEAARAAGKIGGISTRVQKSLQKFVALIDKLRKSAADNDDLEIILSVLLNETKYVDYLRNSIKTEEDEQRLENVQELLSEVREYDADYAQIQKENEESALFPEQVPKIDKLGRFLEQIALVNDVDSWNADDDRVSLMTLHAAKGLEFPVVYLIAVEDGVIPHERSFHDKRQLEEERRLLFVGLTRAKEELRISRTRFREFRGSFSPSSSSRFLFEFPKQGVDKYDSIEEWFKDVREKIASDPECKLVVPKLFQRKEGTSQRQSLWEEGIERAAYVDNASELDGYTVRFSGSSPFNRRRAFNNPSSDYTNAECVDEPSADDYSQERNDKFDAMDEQPSDESVYFNEETNGELVRSEDVYMEETPKKRVVLPDSFDEETTPDFADFDETEASTLRRKRKPKTKKTLSPNALSVGSSLSSEPISGDHKSEAGLCPLTVQVNSFVRHKKFGVGVVKKISGPSFDRIAVVSFLSGVGQIELPLSDPDLSLVAVGRGARK